MKTPPGLEGAVTGVFRPPAALGVCERGGREDNAADPVSSGQSRHHFLDEHDFLVPGCDYWLCAFAPKAIFGQGIVAAVAAGLALEVNHDSLQTDN